MEGFSKVIQITLAGIVIVPPTLIILAFIALMLPESRSMIMSGIKQSAAEIQKIFRRNPA